MVGFLIICIIYAIPIVEKWQKNPIELAFEQKFVPITEISFPAITICPLQMPNNQIYNYSEELLKASKSGFRTDDVGKLQMFKLISQTCFSQLTNYLSELANATELFPETMTNIDDDYGFIDEYFLPSTFSLYQCKGMKKEEFWKCDVELHRHLLDVGLCYSFNMLPRDQILRPGITYPLAQNPNYIPPNIPYFKSEHKSSVKDKSPNTYRVSHTHQELEFETHFYNEFEHEICRPDFLLYIHSPNELPWDQTNRFRMQFNNEDMRELFVAVEPDIINSDEKLRSYSPKERDCYFSNEFPLKYFLEYSKNKCEYECYINVTEEKYKCLPDFMPRSSETKVCSLSEMIFLLQNYWSFENEKRKFDCNCLNDCNSINYNVRLSNIHHSRKKSQSSTNVDFASADDVFSEDVKSDIGEKIYLMKTDPKNIPTNITDVEMQEMIKTNFSVLLDQVHFKPLSWKDSYLHIYYSKSQFLPMKRFTTYTFADFISQCGGIFGGIMGFSFLSFIEIFYFCTIRFLEKRKMTPIDVIQDELNEL